jgi:hypothetical protein
MPRFDPRPRLRRALQRLRAKAAGYVGRFGRQTEEFLSGETEAQPIDFSAPSIPYYENLAARLGFAKVVLYMALFVFVVVTVICNHKLITYENLYYLAKDIGAATQTAQSRADQVSYPISSSGTDFALYRGGIAVAGSEVVTVLSGSGRQTLSENVAYADPCVRAGESFCLTFGRGEKSFAVYNAFVRVHAETTDFPIYDAAVGGDGSFAVVTRSRDYKSEVLLYDGNMERVAAYRLNGYVMGVSMNESGDRLGVVSVESKNNIWVTKVTVIRIGNRITESTATLEGTLGSTCGFITEDRFAVLFSDRLMVFAGDATVMGEKRFEGSTPTLAAIGRGSVAVLSRESDGLSSSMLTVYDRNAREDYSLELPSDHIISQAGDPTTLCFGGNALYLRAGDTLFHVTGSGRSITALSVSRDTLNILPVDANEALICTPAYAYRVESKEFH